MEHAGITWVYPVYNYICTAGISYTSSVYSDMDHAGITWVSPVYNYICTAGISYTSSCI